MDLFMDTLSEHPTLLKRYFKGGPGEARSNLCWNLAECNWRTPRCAALHTSQSICHLSLLTGVSQKALEAVPQLLLWKNSSKMSVYYWDDFCGKGLLIPFHWSHLHDIFWTILVFRRFYVLLCMSSHLLFPTVLLGFLKKELSKLT